ncbi:asparagine synthase (glutamine-hydrolyzing) [Francisella sp. LA112445]|uniref:asparagine synthase (glutamine-hydrolyzing) n=1 Tax=Francisella sp. LA112445 TaxID=1395624 RepID=UPI001788DDD1|nr:asparagine synthase (glutamine-hydrolyzing) [Francisella sp. LA112445]QIW09670.1 asparagine synthase (glutamine-hydrolyzing) [Francisella sp. LA112445]
MCGILGFISGNDFDGESLISTFKNSLNVIDHRGPDDRGVFFNNKVIFGQTRLSIHDLSDAGHQPMICKQTGVVLIYNGEIYNFRDLRKELESKGATFESDSDTEVLLKGYTYNGLNIINQIDGMFAFSIYDPRTNMVYIARDRVGIKPLYLYKYKDTITFSSEIKALKHFCDNRLNIVDLQGLSEYMWYGNALGRNTLYKNIKKVLPGSFISYNLKTKDLQEKIYFGYSNIQLNKTISFDESKDKIRQLLIKAVGKQLSSDVPIGALLSGGIDSSSIVSIASREYGSKLNTYTAKFDFDINGSSEAPIAARLAKDLSTNHNEIYIKGGMIPELLESMVGIHDEPFADAANLPLYLISRELKKDVTVVLQGDGGDEIFAGYNRYMMLSQYQMYTCLSKALNPLKFILARFSGLNSKLRILDIFNNNDLYMKMALLLTTETIKNCPIKRIFNNDFIRKINFAVNPFLEYERSLSNVNNNQDLINKMLFVDMQNILPNTFLEKVDKPTMSNSIEVRVPFLDHDLMDFAMSIPGDFKVKKRDKKFLLKSSMRGLVPDYILDGPKKGFSVPYAYWLKNDCRDILYYYIDYISYYYAEIFDKNKLLSLANDHCAGSFDNGFILWKFLNLAIWLKKEKVFI